jgi:hypothetical protein
MEINMENANTKPIVTTSKVKLNEVAPVVTKPKYWLKDNYRTKRWVVLSVPNCDLTPKALDILREHGETFSHQVYSVGSAQDALTRGHNFSPCIYADNKLIGSLGDLESYFKRNFFSSILEGIE